MMWYLLNLTTGRIVRTFPYEPGEILPPPAAETALREARAGDLMVYCLALGSEPPLMQTRPGPGETLNPDA